MDRRVEIDGHTLTFTNLDKVFWPDTGVTKGDLLAYYDQVSKYLIPHLKGRPESLNRFPNGITGEHFFQKNLEEHPDWIKVFEGISGIDGHTVHYAICDDRATLYYILNLGCIDLNVWNSRMETPDEPDFLVFDLDPVDIDFKFVTEVALKIRDTLLKIGVKSYPKTSGKRGLHLYAPLAPGYTYDQARDFAHLLALYVNENLPELTSLERSPKDRVGKVYIDYLQNRKGSTMAAPYSVRPTALATVSTPLTWEEVEKGARPEDFTITNVLERLEEIGDIFAPVLGKGINLETALNKLKDL